MNLIGYRPYHSINLTSRNEGRIKRYESCQDLRAWSHDISQRDYYLREWMKSEMAICVIPFTALASIIKRMTCHSRPMTVPRCHLHCKSKVVLERICNSCDAIKECFRNDQKFRNFFEEEELETSSWPCERCLDALKGLKMLWRIIVEKLFHVKISKSTPVSECNTDSLTSLTRNWQDNIVHETLIFRKMSPNTNRFGTPVSKREFGTGSISTLLLSKPCCKMTGTEDLRVTSRTRHLTAALSPFKIPKNATASQTTVNTGCQCSHMKDELGIYEDNLIILQDKFNSQKEEIDKLVKDNNALKDELQRIYKQSSKAMVNPAHLKHVEDLPKPFESYFEDQDNTEFKNIGNPVDSEMIITMKNCKDKTFRHISLLQVLHKSNTPVVEGFNCRTEKKADPAFLLAKVQSAFGAIVDREVDLVAQNTVSQKLFDVDASVLKMSATRSEPSCSTTSLCSESFFEGRFIREL